jgi:hypothetical protein
MAHFLPADFDHYEFDGHKGLLHPGCFPGTSGETIIWDEFSLGCLELNTGAIFSAAASLDPRKFKVRKVENWQAYDADARTSFPLSALRRPNRD